MNAILILNREMTPEELKRMYVGFDKQTTENEVDIQSAVRIGLRKTLSKSSG